MRQSGHLKLLMVLGSTEMKSTSMGDMEMIDKFGVRITFTQDGQRHIDLVPKWQCCQVCNDPRLITEGNRKVCVACGCVNAF